MNTRTIDDATRANTSRPLNSALLRVASTAALSVLFALIHCVAPADHGQGLAAPAVAQVSATASADSVDHPVGAGAHTRRN